MRRLLLLIVLLLAIAAVAGCGNKGPLVRPAATTTVGH
ncbi:MAG TPA: lipoprotein [Rhodanobacteraceae bacterium]|nr:lipoprotein [Rhodanobacteraceae bacterium]